jgi:hypothetical protein
VVADSCAALPINMHIPFSNAADSV